MSPWTTPDHIEHLFEEFFRVLEHDVLESRSRPFLRAEVSHREAVLDTPRGCRHADPAFPGLAHHLVLVRGPPAHGVLLDRPSPAMRGPIEPIRFDRERRAVVPHQVHVRFLACADQAHDFRREPGGQDRLDDGPVVRFLEGELPGVDAPLDAGVQVGAVRHRFDSFVSRWRSQGERANAGTPKRSQAAPGAVRKTMQDIMPGTSWSTRPSYAMVGSTFNLSARESVRRGTETLKPPRALGPGEALVVVQITLVGERQAQAGHEFIYRGPQPECTPCKVRSACLNQDLGRRYRITRVRDVSHPCLLNEERARVVEVEPIPPDCSLSARVGVEGAVLAYEKIVCSNGACPNFRLCHPVGVEPGMRIRVVELGPELECPLGYSLVSAKVSYGD